MRHSSKPTRAFGPDQNHANTPRPNKSPYISDALRSWIKNVVAPALVKAYLAEQALRKGEAHA